MITVASIIAAVLACIGLGVNQWAVRALPAPLAFLILGNVVEPDLDYYTRLDLDIWLMTLGALAMAAGGVLLLRGLKVVAEPARPSYGQNAAPAAPRASSPAPTPQLVAATAGPPAGWYADPARQAAQRYWSGAAWTGHLR
jgi:hypothetical protein